VKPNAQDKLPGRLQRRYVSQSCDAGPVNFIGWFGLARFVPSKMTAQSSA
jgi:hypothetical protein